MDGWTGGHMGVNIDEHMGVRMDGEISGRYSRQILWLAVVGKTEERVKGQAYD